MKNPPGFGGFLLHGKWSARLDLNQQQPPWQGGTLPLSYARAGRGADQTPYRVSSLWRSRDLKAGGVGDKPRSRNLAATSSDKTQRTMGA